MDPNTSEEASKIRVLVVDDHPLVRTGLAQIIRRQHDLLCCGEADSHDSALMAADALKPDLVTVDIRMQSGDGLDLIKALNARHPKVFMLVISQCDEELYAERALKAGARGYVMKERATAEVLSAIRTIMSGEVYVSPKIAAMALQLLIGNNKSGTYSSSIHLLSNRELQVLQLLGAGLNTRKIAARMGLSFKTVETHKENMKHKLRLASAAELAHYAVNWVNGLGSVHPPDRLSLQL